MIFIWTYWDNVYYRDFTGTMEKKMETTDIMAAWDLPRGLAANPPNKIQDSQQPRKKRGSF